MCVCVWLRVCESCASFISANCFLSSHRLHPHTRSLCRYIYFFIFTRMDFAWYDAWKKYTALYGNNEVRRENFVVLLCVMTAVSPLACVAAAALPQKAHILPCHRQTLRHQTINRNFSNTDPNTHNGTSEIGYVVIIYVCIRHQMQLWGGCCIHLYVLRQATSAAAVVVGGWRRRCKCRTNASFHTRMFCITFAINTERKRSSWWSQWSQL